MTAPLFRLSAHSSVAQVALVSITATATSVVYTNVHCVERVTRGGATFRCSTWLFAFPGLVKFDLRKMEHTDDRGGHGVVAKCRKCHSLYEVVEGAQP